MYKMTKTDNYKKRYERLLKIGKTIKKELKTVVIKKPLTNDNHGLDGSYYLQH